MKTIKRISIRLDKFSQAKYLNDCILHEKSQGSNELSVQILESTSYSNVCAPIAGIIDFYKTQGMKILEHCPRDSYASRLHISNPRPIEEIDAPLSPFDKIFTFSTEEGVAKIVNLYVLALRESAELETGIIQSLEWCMNESIDNVLQHSCSDKGFVMAQLHKQSKTFCFCVFDYGLGIYNSLRNSKHAPTTPLQAITLAMSERITRDENIGQGNGLWGLSNIIKEANGRLLISSGGARYLFNNGDEQQVETGDFNLGRQHGTTIVDFQLNYSTPIDVARALNGYEPTDFWAEQHENENGQIEIDVASQANGTGTRRSAERLKNIVVNFLKGGHSPIILDFQNVRIISSSFADELIGKLIGTLGFSKFMQHIVISNVNDFNEAVINRSVGQRMAQIFMGERIVEED